MNLTLNPDLMPARIHFERRLTDLELMQFSEGLDGWPVEREPNGDLTLMSPNFTAGSEMNLEICFILKRWAKEDGRGRTTGPDAGFNLPDGSMRSPDAAWFSHKKFSQLPEEKQQGFSHICPEFVIELRSKSDRIPDLREKMDIWIANGAEVAWLIDPQSRTVTIYRPNESPEELLDPTSVQGTGPILGFELVMSEVWGPQTT